MEGVCYPAAVQHVQMYRRLKDSGGEACAVNAVRVYIYAKCIGDSLHGRTLKSALQQNGTRNSEHIMA